MNFGWDIDNISILVVNIKNNLLMRDYLLYSESKKL
ncbi:hypothetical protein CLV82_1213 [Zeaxanthinibacter enoshimensis]|uniref:Uncharacterized protein n=1 Tax=Zeaxanthinibacter enoshimensis TaxID=392009 RepID=A0A4R6TP60_9FLAO|nr:hypothetical protein CLV82_1213 [Zeaxanthinibacter enoshimensis]